MTGNADATGRWFRDDGDGGAREDNRSRGGGEQRWHLGGGLQYFEARCQRLSAYLHVGVSVWDVTR